MCKNMPLVIDGEKMVTNLQPSSSANDGKPGTLYITVGPPCAGKTTLLKKLNVTDIALDDQPGVYIALPTSHFLDKNISNNKNSSDKNSNSEVVSDGSVNSYNETRVFGKSISDRLSNEVELRYVLQRLGNQLDPEEFSANILGFISDQNVAQYLVNAVETVIDETNTKKKKKKHKKEKEKKKKKSKVKLPKTVDLFIQEAIFRGSPTGIERVEALLRQHSQHDEIALGNTNTRPSDYKVALEIAQQQGRSVKFLIHHAVLSDVDPNVVDESKKIKQSQKQHTQLLKPDLFDMHGNIQELMYRNIRRLLETGRYIPASVIHTMYNRTAQVLENVVCKWQCEQNKKQELDTNGNYNKTLPTTSFTKFDLHKGLARLINYELHANGTVSAIPQPPPRGKKRPRSDSDVQRQESKSKHTKFDEKSNQNNKSVVDVDNENGVRSLKRKKNHISFVDDSKQDEINEQSLTPQNHTLTNNTKVGNSSKSRNQKRNNQSQSISLPKHRIDAPERQIKRYKHSKENSTDNDNDNIVAKITRTTIKKLTKVTSMMRNFRLRKKRQESQV